MIFLKLYLLAGLLAGLYLMGVFAYEDIFKGPGYKFGYNYKSGMSWIMLAFYVTPIINLYTLWAMTLYLRRKLWKAN